MVAQVVETQRPWVGDELAEQSGAGRRGPRCPPRSVEADVEEVHEAVAVGIEDAEGAVPAPTSSVADLEHTAQHGLQTDLAADGDDGVEERRHLLGGERPGQDGRGSGRVAHGRAPMVERRSIVRAEVADWGRCGEQWGRDPRVLLDDHEIVRRGLR